MTPRHRLGKSVLVVDDDQQTRDTLTQALEGGGYAVRQASDGAAALRDLRYGPRPDVIVLEMALPVMNGWEFLERQAQDPELAGIPVVVFSPAYEAGPWCPAPLGVARFVPKPADGGEALAVVNDVIKVRD